MPTQVQIRGAANATQQARTLASRELDIDTTNKRLAVHDGSTVGGIEHANFIDIQNNRFTYAAASGTNTITVTYSPVPSARATGQIWRFKAANTTTGAATFNPNGLGAGTIYKKDGSTNALVAIGANDILQNGFYEVIDIDGSTGYQLLDSRGGGLTLVAQSDLDTLTGSVAQAGTSPVRTVYENLTLPGGQYGFYPQFRTSSTANGANQDVQIVGAQGGNFTFTSNTSLIACMNKNGTAITHTLTQRYVAACPPYNLGDGDMMGFAYAKIASNGDIRSTYMADDPPWANNGPTDIRPTRVCPRTKQEYIRQKKLPTWHEVLDGALPTYEEVPLTQKIKNADMAMIPHPFGTVMPDETVVLLDPMDERVKRMMAYQNAGGDVQDFIKHLKPSLDPLKRKQIKGVRQVAFTF